MRACVTICILVLAGHLSIASLIAGDRKPGDVSGGYIQVYNDGVDWDSQLLPILKVAESFPENGVVILQFTTWTDESGGTFNIGYDKANLFRWCRKHRKKLLIGLNGSNEGHESSFWSENRNVDELVRLDEDVVKSWTKVAEQIGETDLIAGFYSSYEPLSTKYYPGAAYGDYLSRLSGFLEKWSVKYHPVHLVFSCAVADHKADSDAGIRKDAFTFRVAVRRLAERVLSGRKGVTLVFALQDGAGERQIPSDQLKTKIRPFFQAARKSLEDSSVAEAIQLWPLIEAFDRNGTDVRVPTSQVNFDARWKTIAEFGWSGTGESYRVVVFDLRSFSTLR